MSEADTDFGYKKVARTEKEKLVAGVFTSVAGRYDLMNDLMSLGLHRLWKGFAIQVAELRPGERVLDVAGGTGDLSAAAAKRVGCDGQVWLTDINGEMLGIGRDRVLDDGRMLPAARCNAEALPFPDGHFDCVMVGFGLRNMTHKERALGEMRRVLKPGGRVLVLEFSRVWKPLAPLYDLYSFRVLPWLGARVAGDAESYRYLAESIRMHPDQSALRALMEQAGLQRVEYFNLSAGVVAIHRGYRID